MTKRKVFTYPNVWNFSGGKSSALMTIKGYKDGDIVLFTDTLREHKKTYEFIDNFEKYEGIPVHRAVYTHEQSPGLEGFSALTFRKSYLPNREKRICTDELKVKTAKRYLRSLGIQHYTSFIGFRTDEQPRILDYKQRYKKVKPRFLLDELGIDKEQVNHYWENKPYTLEIPSILGNCDACFLKGINALIRIFQKHPELAEEWIADEDLAALKRPQNKPTFIKGISYREILRIAQSQPTLFDGLEQVEPAYGCACTSY